jgi:protein TonB
VPAIAVLESATPTVTSGQAAVATDGTPASGPAALIWSTRASYQYNPKPAYPAVARRQGQEGLVLLHVTVTPEGRPSMVRISQSSGYALLDEAAQNAVRRWKFAPVRVGRVPVTSEVEVPIQFNLAER